MKFASHYSQKKRVQITFPEQGRTRQSCRDECDINKILKKFNVTEAHLHANRHQGEYGFATSETLHDALNTVTKATSMFEELPAHVRSRFNGDAGEFLDFVGDESNGPEMAKLGLTTREYAQSVYDAHNRPDEAPEVEKTDTEEKPTKEETNADETA